MPPGEQKTSRALLVSQRAGTSSVTSMAKILKGSDKSSGMLRVFLKNVHLSVISRKEEDLVANRIENSNAPGQRDGEEPILQVVRIAVKPPTTKPRHNEWDETVNFEPNSKKWAGGLRYQNKDQAGFVSIEVPYEIWRKHYAKNKYGRYRGTEAPAENCILLPEDEVKWRSPTVLQESNESTEKQDMSEDPQSLKRTDTSLGYDPVDPPHTIQSPVVRIQKEEAIFIETDGHAALQAVRMPVVPQSPLLPNSSSCIL